MALQLCPSLFKIFLKICFLKDKSYSLEFYLSPVSIFNGGKEGREGGRGGAREGRRERERRKGRKEGGREGGKEGERKEGGGKEGGGGRKKIAPQNHLLLQNVTAAP